MTILDEIIGRKRDEVARAREFRTVRSLESTDHFTAPTVSLVGYLRRPDLSGVMAEFKRRSPSKGAFEGGTLPAGTVTVGYMQAGASALSVLTDSHYFGGSADDLTIARRFNYCPILRKDFLVDEYQVIEARSIGADAVLVIAGVLPPAASASLVRTAKSLGMEVLLEVHDAGQLDAYFCEGVDAVGINSRDLRDFSVDPDRALAVLPSVPAGVCKVAESGIREPGDVARLRAAGFDAFLIGEAFMRDPEPHRACARFIAALPSRP